MSPVARTIAISLLAFAVPLSVASYLNWPALRPYVIGDPATAEGHLLYFARRG